VASQDGGREITHPASGPYEQPTAVRAGDAADISASIEYICGRWTTRPGNTGTGS
jgi:hypothetical protein